MKELERMTENKEDGKMHRKKRIIRQSIRKRKRR